jgi:hypothetical protein
VRHLRSILYAIVLAPAVWILCGVGFTQNLTGRARDGGGVESITGLLLLLLAGATYAILVFAPISPAGPLLSGLVFLGISVWALAAPSSYAGIWAPGVSKEGFDLSRPGYGLAALLAVPLVCTALSARRWERYEPPQLPLIGTLGPARGTARPAGMPASVVETAVMDRPASTDAPAVVVPADETAVMNAVRAEPPAEPVAEPATADVAPSDEAPTEPVPTALASSGEALTEDEAPTEDEAATEAATSTDEAPVAPAEEALATYEVSSSGEITLAKATSDNGDTDSVPAPAQQDQTTGVGAATDEENETAAAVAIPPAMDEKTDVAPGPGPAGETAAAEDETAAAAPAAIPDRSTATAPAAAADEATTTAPADDGHEKTQVIKVPVADRSNHNLDRRPGGKPTQDFDRTKVIRPGEQTQVVPIGRGEETQVIKLPEQRKQPVDVEATQVIKLPGPHKLPANEDRTQVIKRPDQRNQPIDGDHTQVIRIPTGTVEPPGENTQVLRFPAKNPPGEAVTVRREPPKAPSIVGAERPNPGDDPTTRIVPPHRAGQPGQDADDETTVDVGGGKRLMTVMNLERPAGEAADDTRRLFPPPAKRHPEDETT